MKKISAIVFFMNCTCLFLSWTTVSYAQDSSYNAIRWGYQFIAVDGDEGRFREDQYRTDDHLGGLEKYIYSTKSGDKTFDLDLRAIYDYDYGLNLGFSKEDTYYLSLKSRQTRRYYDGSNEAWNPAQYLLADEFADREDGHMYVDRLNTDFEIGFPFKDAPDLSFGWSRWVRDGEETLLRGERVKATGKVTNRSFPAYSEVQGISDTFFVKLSETFAEKYNVSLKQEIESYRDNQRIIFPRYNNGALEQFRTFEDEPAFVESLSHLSFNSFINNGTYVSGNYLFQNLKNTSLRSVVRPGDANPNFFIRPDVDNQRRANVANLGVVFLDKFVKDLRCGLNVRAEGAATKSDGQGLINGTTFRYARSEKTEQNFAEALSLTYSGIKKITLSYMLELEQRDIDWDEAADLRSHEIITEAASRTIVAAQPFLDRVADISHNDVISTLTANMRLNSKNKFSLKYKNALKRRGYRDIYDSDESFYPGKMGSSREDLSQYSAKFSSNLKDSWVLGLEYLFEEDERGFAFQNGTDGQKIMRNRLSANLCGSLTGKLTLNFTAMGEDFELDTPAVGTATNHAQGESAFDYDADVYLASATGNYKFSDKTKGYLTLTYTRACGTVSNILNELFIGLSHNLSDDEGIDTRLELYNFDDLTGNGFDNYRGIGVYLSYNKQF